MRTRLKLFDSMVLASEVDETVIGDSDRYGEIRQIAWD